MNTKTKLILCFILLFNSYIGARAQQINISDIAGYYPLKMKVVNPQVDYAKFNEISTWDLSINCNNGISESGNSNYKFRPDEDFEPGSFLGLQSCIKKTTTNKGRIKLLSDPLINYDWNN